MPLGGGSGVRATTRGECRCPVMPLALALPLALAVVVARAAAARAQKSRGADRAAPGAALLPVRRHHPRCGAAGGPRILTGQRSGAGHRPGGRRASRGRRRLAHGAHQSITPGGRPLRGAAARVRAGVVWSAAARRSGVRGADPARHGRGRARPRGRRPAAFESRPATGELPLDRAGRRRRRASPRGHHRAPAGAAFPVTGGAARSRSARRHARSGRGVHHPRFRSEERRPHHRWRRQCRPPGR